MKGVLASRYPDEKGEYSDLKVMQSGAGWYIGTAFEHLDGECKGIIEPGSRESEYFESKKDAQTALDEGTWNQRNHP